MRIAVTGAGGRLGSALVTALAGAQDIQVLAWDRAAFDLDRPDAIGMPVARERPDMVIHAAGWTDVDGCARDPNLAMVRNGEATGSLATACAATGASLIFVSTNEVFPGTRVDGRGYASTDPTEPANPYGASKLAGELLASEAFEGTLAEEAAPRLAIVRTAWLFGPGKPDFPARIAVAARQASADGRHLRVVGDEIGTPTYVPDLAVAIVGLVRAGDFAGVHHIVNRGRASRAEWARDVLARLYIRVEIEEIRLDDYVRPSRPPRWGVLEPTPIPGGLLRDWGLAMADRASAMTQWTT